MSKKKKIGLCLSGGANKGAWQEGVVEALEDRGIKFDLIAGTSIGGVVGAMVASSMPIEKRQWWWENLTWGKITNMRFPPIFAGLWGDSFYSDRKFKKLFRKELPESFKDLDIPLVVTASDINSNCISKSLIVMKHGNLELALRATVAIPGIFPPVRVNGKVLIDGGIGNYVPIGQFDGFDYVYVLIAGYGVLPKAPRRALEIIFRSIDIYQQEEIIREIQSHKGKPKLIVIWNKHPEILNSSIFDWNHGKRWIELGYEDGMLV